MITLKKFKDQKELAILKDDDIFRLVNEVLEDAKLFWAAKPSLNELGLTRYLCDLIRNRYDELGTLDNIREDIERLTGKSISVNLIGRLRNGCAFRLRKHTHIELMNYAQELNIKIPRIILAYYKCLLREKL